MLLANASIGAAGVQVSYGPPGAGVQQESVWLGRVAMTEEVSQLGENMRRENYTIDVVILVTRDGSDAQTVERRASAIRSALELGLRDATGRYLNGAVNLFAEVAGFEMDLAVTEKGGQWIAEQLVKVGCSHRK
jgi:hypothetical protein